MADFNELKAIIEDAIRENGREEITGDILQGVLLSIVDKLGDEEINTLYQLVSDEVEARQTADNTLQSNIDAEELRAKGAERTNAEAIVAEENRAKEAERVNAQAIADEETRAKAAEKANADDIDIIESKIPAQASAQNQLADKQYVDDKVATDTATFRGTYNLVTDLELTILATQEQIATALAAKMSELSIVPDNNDYSFVQIPTSDATPTEIARIDRYKYNGSVWAFEYSLNNSGFTAAQWATINSGLVSGDKTKLDALPTNAELTILLNGKEAVSNKVTSISAESTDAQYPSAKSVWTAITAWLSGAMSWTAAQMKQARANLGFGNGDIDDEPSEESSNLVTSGGIFTWVMGLISTAINTIKEWTNGIFAKIDGYYATLIAGAAENLVGRGSVNAEYRFRPTAGSSSVGSGAATITKMLGNTLVWNQLVQNGNFASSSGWGAFGYTSVFSNNSVTLTKEQVSGVNYTHFRRTIPHIPVGHKVFMWIEYASSRSGVRFEITYSDGVDISTIYLSNTSLQKRVTKSVVTTSTSVKRYVDIVDYNNSALTLIVYNIKIVDLTLMYGAGNEPTAAQFEAMYPLKYYAFNAGILINNEATGIKTVGFNLYNPTTGKAYVTGATGTADLTNGKNCYQITGAYTSITDAAGNAITPNEGGFFEVATAQELTVAGGDSTTTCLHLTYSGYRNGEYEAYWESLLNLNLKTLTGKLNGEGESIIVRPNGFEAVGTIADEGIVEGGNLTKINVKIGNQVINGAIGDTITLEGCSTSATSFLCASNIGTLSGGVLTLTAAATNVEVYYPLAQLKTYILDTPIPVIYREDDFGSEERLPADTENSVTAPIKYEVAYPMNAVDEIRNLPANYVSGKEVQTFTSTEKEQARQNIGAASLADVQTMFSALPTTDPQVAGELWNDNGTVKISAGV